MATLTGELISETYDSLLKVTDNNTITGIKKRITDGFGNQIPLLLSSTDLEIDGKFILSALGDIEIGTKFLTLKGDNSIAYRSANEVLSDIGGASSSSISGTSGNLAKFDSSGSVSNSILNESDFTVNLTDGTSSYASFGIVNPGTPGDPGVDNDAYIGSTINNDFLIRVNNVEGLRVDTSLRLKIANIQNATVYTDKFLVSDGGVVKYRTASELLSDINAQGAITLTTTGTSGAATLVGNTLNIPNYSTDLSGYVPTSRTLTINGTAYDLSDNRSWNVGTVKSVGMVSATSGVTIGSSPVVENGNITLAIATASSGQNGLLSATDWNTFNNKVSTSTLASYVPYTGATANLNLGNNLLYASSGVITGFTSGNGGSLSFNQNTAGTFIPSGSLTSIYAESETKFGINYRTSTGANRGLVLSSGLITVGQTRTFDFPDASGTVTLSSGRTNFIPKLTSANVLGESQIQDNGSSVAIGYNTNPGLFGLDVNGTGRFSSSITSTQGIFRNSGVPAIQVIRDLNVGVVGTAGQSIEFGALSGSTPTIGATIFGALEGSATGGNLVFQTLTGGSLSTKLTLASTGAATFSSSVTAKTTEAAEGISILGRSDDYSILRFKSAASVNKFTIYSNPNDLIFDNPTVGTAMIIKQGGNVGIGTASPSLKAEIMGVNSLPATSGTNQTAVARFSQNAGQSVMDAFVNGSVGAGFQVTNSADLSLKYPLLLQPNGGNVLIGTTTDNGYKLRMNGNGNAIWLDNGAGNSQIFMTSGSNFYITTNNSQGVVLNNGSTSWGTYSDSRLKNITGNITNALSDINTLSAIKYNLKSDETKKERVGLIAQEVQKILPQVVDEDDKGMLSVRYSEIIPLLIASIQELKTEIDLLKNK